MEAGRALDALVAEKVMGARLVEFARDFTAGTFIISEDSGVILAKGKIGTAYQFRPSTDIAAAWQVVEKLRKSHCCLTLKSDFDYIWECYAIKDENDAEHQSEIIVDYKVYAKAETAPLAICLAALKAMGVNMEETA